MGFNFGDYFLMNGYYGAYGNNNYLYNSFGFVDNYGDYDITDAFFGSSKSSSKSSKTSFMDTLYGYMPKTESVFDQLAKIREVEMKQQMSQLLTKLQAEGNTRQAAILGTMMEVYRIGEEADAFGRCMDIASRLILGGAVTGEDISFLAQNNPELYANARANTP